MTVQYGKLLCEVMSECSVKGEDWYVLSNNGVTFKARAKDCIPTMTLKETPPGVKFKFEESPEPYIAVDVNSLNYTPEKPFVAVNTFTGEVKEFSGNQPVHPA